MREFLKTIDFKKLKEHRFNVEYIAEFEPLEDKDINSIYEIVELIDNIQTRAIKEGYTEEEIYGTGE